MSQREIQRQSPWPHRLAVLLALVTFPLIWVGGLVTTYDAGMAVPDWPGTYGYNLFAYPWTTWVAGPWDLFIEHGHRLLGATAGLVAIALVIVTFLTEKRTVIRFAAAGALVLVVVQGALGGARVLLDARLVAMIHGCLGPAFFAYLAALIAATSCRPPSSERTAAPVSTLGPLARTAWILAALACGQLILGAVLRHIPYGATPQVFRIALVFHLVVAAAVVLQVGWTAVQAWPVGRQFRGLRSPSLALLALVALQIVLGLATYVAKYSWPAWFGDYQFAAAYVVEERSLHQALVTTAHVAGGSLILFTAVTLAMRSSLAAVSGESRAPSAHSQPASPFSALLWKRRTAL
ncbi:MAG: COX15/CtaA family protein [Pirellulaceae bacterium]|nr:COX15/CtaA family protein [Pirellulaceae bacterium]